MLAEYGSTLVMVANLDERWKALAPHMPASMISQLTPIHYCILELVGKSRHNVSNHIKWFKIHTTLINVAKITSGIHPILIYYSSLFPHELSVKINI